MLNIFQVGKKKDQERLKKITQLLIMLSGDYIKLTDPRCLIFQVPHSAEGHSLHYTHKDR